MGWRKLGSAFLAVAAVGITALPAVLAAARQAEGTGHADGWFLVRLAAPLVEKRADESFATRTGRAALDVALDAAGARRIEHALPASNGNARFAERRARYGIDRTYKVLVPAGSDIPAVVRSFAALPGVEFAEPDFVGSGSGVRFPTDPLFSSQYGFHQPSDADVDGPEAWAIATGSPFVIAVLDSGIDSDHPDLDDKIVPGYDFVNADADPEDDHGHGTNVSSIAAAESDNGIGVAGACWNCRIMPLKVLNAGNTGFYSHWADAMVWATDHGARVFNLSAGGSSPSATLLAGVAYAYDAGVTQVSITHNFNTGSITYPGRYAQTIALGATDASDFRVVPFCYSATSGSNWGPQIDVVAPGELILGAARGGGYNSWCGTSQAAPLAAGLAGLMHTLNPAIGREETRHLMRAAAEDRVGRPNEDVPGFDNYHGWGRVNMERTLEGTQAATSLRVEGQAATRVYHDRPNPLATAWDFIRGELGAYTETAAGVDLGSVTCLELVSPDADTAGNEDTATPAPGQAFYYLSRFYGAPLAGLPGSFGGSSQNRDRFLTGCEP